ncbi:hypothetical protein [Hydrogenophilus thermoluteolus]
MDELMEWVRQAARQIKAEGRAG